MMRITEQELSRELVTTITDIKAKVTSIEDSLNKPDNIQNLQSAINEINKLKKQLETFVTPINNIHTLKQEIDTCNTKLKDVDSLKQTITKLNISEKLNELDSLKNQMTEFNTKIKNVNSMKTEIQNTLSSNIKQNVDTVVNNILKGIQNESEVSYTGSLNNGKCFLCTSKIKNLAITTFSIVDLKCSNKNYAEYTFKLPFNVTEWYYFGANSYKINGNVVNHWNIPKTECSGYLYYKNDSENGKVHGNIQGIDIPDNTLQTVGFTGIIISKLK